MGEDGTRRELPVDPPERDRAEETPRNSADPAPQSPKDRGRIGGAKPVTRLVVASLPIALVALALFVGVLVLSAGVENRKNQLKAEREAAAANREVPLVPVDVVRIELEPLTDTIQLPGVVKPWEEVMVRAEVTGTVSRLHVMEGDRVEAGAPLVDIDPRDYEANLKQAQAELELARRNLERDEKLREDGVIPQATLDTTRANAQRAEAAADLADLRLQRCRILAPFAGVVESRDVAPGALLSPGTAVVELVDVSRVKVDIGIPEMDVARVRGLESARIDVPCLPKSEGFEGETMYVSTTPGEGGQTYRLRLAVDNASCCLQPGMFVQADVVRERKPESIVVPLYSVVTRGEETFCFVAEDDTATKRPVVVGCIQDNRAEIVEGLRAGDLLIVRGQRQLAEGEKLEARLVDSEPAQPSADTPTDSPTSEATP